MIKTSKEIAQEYNVTMDGMTASKRWIDVNTLFDKLLDPEVIAKYGKTQQERMVINTYIRCFKETFLR